MSRTRLWTRGLAVAAALCGALLAGAAAQDDGEAEAAGAALAGATQPDPPGRVGRVSAVVGAVDLSQGAGAPWELARINQPVTGQTALFAPPGSQAEVRIGSTSVRLDADTQAVFSQLDDHAIAIDVAQGTVRARVRNLPTGDAFSLAADGVRAQAEQPGDYRVSYDPDNRAYTVRALAGELRMVTPSGSYTLEGGQEIVVEDGGAKVRLQPLGEPDAFDAWAVARDRQQDALASARYVSPETTGIEALDEHGAWDVTEDYGAVWYPRSLPSGWAPYRYGHWAHVQPWGWTWVDDAPWGFAPFHYGRWALIGSRWGWVPGPIVAQPVWAPALVGYVGGSRLSIGIGIGAPIGWFPLGPHEHYHPPYRYSQHYWDHVNWRKKHGGKHRDWRDKHRRDRDGWRDDRRGDDDHDRGDRRMRHHQEPRYRYARRPDALTVVSADSFRGSRHVAGERLPLDAGQIAQLAPFSPGLRLPDATPKLGNTPAFGTRAGSPALRLPAAPPRGLRERDRDGDGSRWRRAPRERAGDDGERRMVSRPPAFGEGPRRGWRDQGPARRGERRDRGGEHVVPMPRGARADRDGDARRAIRPQPAVRPVQPVTPPTRGAEERPGPPVRAIAPERRMQESPVLRALQRAYPDQAVPERQLSPMERAIQRANPSFAPVRPVPGRPTHAVQPPVRAVPGLMPQRVQPAGRPAVRAIAPAPRGGDRGGRVQSPGRAQRQR